MLQGKRKFVSEVLRLSLAEHPNLVKLIGFCAEGEQRLLVYENMPLGSLENHLHGMLYGYFKFLVSHLSSYKIECMSGLVVNLAKSRWHRGFVKAPNITLAKILVA